MDEYIESIRKWAEEARKNGLEVCCEIHNESYHGQAVINILNGLPPDAAPSEVKGCFNGWLQELFPINPTPD